MVRDQSNRVRVDNWDHQSLNRAVPRGGNPCIPYDFLPLDTYPSSEQQYADNNEYSYSSRGPTSYQHGTVDASLGRDPGQEEYLIINENMSSLSLSSSSYPSNMTTGYACASSISSLGTADNMYDGDDNDGYGDTLSVTSYDSTARESVSSRYTETTNPSTVGSRFSHRSNLMNNNHRQRSPPHGLRGDSSIRLPCEFQKLNGCSDTFALDEVQEWKHHTEVHMNRTFPLKLKCWFCDNILFDAKTMSQGDVYHNFNLRMDHIRDHIADRDYRPSDMNQDGYIIQHLRKQKLVDEEEFKRMIQPSTVPPIPNDHHSRGRYHHHRDQKQYYHHQDQLDTVQEDAGLVVEINSSRSSRNNRSERKKKDHHHRDSHSSHSSHKKRSGK